MKKIFISMIAVAMISFAACTGGKKDAEKTQETTETAASFKKFDEYKKLIEEAKPFLQKIAQGDASAIPAYRQIQQKLISLAAEVQAEVADSPEKLKEYRDAVDKFQEEAQKVFSKQTN